MTDQELKDLVANLAVSQAQTQAEVAETSRVIKEIGVRMDAESAETSRVIKEVGRRMGSMASNQGDVAEEFFFNSLNAKPQIGAITFDSVTPNQIFSRKGRQNEFDIVMVNGQSVALIEVKYKAHLSDLDQIEEQVQNYRHWRPEHKDYKIYSGLAGLNVPPDVVKAAQERGVFVLKRTGDVVEVDAQSMKAF
jgi:hypothetical protein